MSNRFVTLPQAEAASPSHPEWFLLSSLKREASELGKPEWRPMLRYLADLHQNAIRKPEAWLPYPWEEIGQGYVGGRAFGHWDIIHQALDTLPSESGHAHRQLWNYLHHQQEDGYIPGTIYFADSPQSGVEGQYPFYSGRSTHPPVWPFAVDECWKQLGDEELLRAGIKAARRQISWFQRNRQTGEGGFYYLDVVENRWESGVDDGIRFGSRPGRAMACVDATAHVYLLADSLCRWQRTLGEEEEEAVLLLDRLQDLLQDGLFCKAAGFFFDAWAVGSPENRPFSFEGMWPMVVGAATAAQAERVIRENLLNPERFLTAHPISTVSIGDRGRFSLRCWRGPAWNSMTYWAARGCARYGFEEAAAVLLERALDQSAKIFGQTGTIWEFYHPFGEDPRTLERKPETEFNTPCRDYLGHNPLFAMVRLWETCRVANGRLSQASPLLL